MKMELTTIFSHIVHHIDFINNNIDAASYYYFFILSASIFKNFLFKPFCVIFRSFRAVCV